MKLLNIGLAAVMLALALTTAGLAQSREITLLIGEQRTVDVPNISGVAIGESSIAEVKIVGNNILITGKSAGLTTLNLIAASGASQSYTVRVLARDPNTLRQEVSELLGDVEGVEIRTVGDRVFIDGFVYREEDRARVDLVVEAFPGTVNLTSFSNEYITVDRLVQVDYNRYEVQKGDGLSLGLNWRDLFLTAQAQPSYNFILNHGDPLSTTVTRTQTTTTPGGATTEEIVGYDKELPEFDNGGNILVVADFNPLRLNQDDNRIRLQDTHQVIVSEGEMARYVVGGELPIPFILEDRIQVEFKEYGAVFDVTPEVDKSENIRLDINMTLSELDFSVQVLNIPGLTKVTQNTTVTLKTGETVVIGGYISTNKTKNEDGIPGLSQVPVLGYLFGSKQFSESQREGVVFITPRLTQPSDDFRNDPAIRGVLENFEQDDFRL